MSLVLACGRILTAMISYFLYFLLLFTFLNTQIWLWKMTDSLMWPWPQEQVGSENEWIILPLKLKWKGFLYAALGLTPTSWSQRQDCVCCSCRLSQWRRNEGTAWLCAGAATRAASTKWIIECVCLSVCRSEAEPCWSGSLARRESPALQWVSRSSAPAHIIRTLWTCCSETIVELCLVKLQCVLISLSAAPHSLPSSSPGSDCTSEGFHAERLREGFPANFQFVPFNLIIWFARRWTDRALPAHLPNTWLECLTPSLVGCHGTHELDSATMAFSLGSERLLSPHFLSGGRQPQL